MSVPTWFILAVDDDQDVLLRCTPDAWTEVTMRPTDTIDDAAEFDRMVSARPGLEPTTSTRRASGAAPRATKAVNDPAQMSHDTQRHLRILGHAVKEAMAPYDDAPLYVAMGESRGSLFEAIGKVDIKAHLASHLRRQDLWQETRALR